MIRGHLRILPITFLFSPLRVESFVNDDGELSRVLTMVLPQYRDIISPTSKAALVLKKLKGITREDKKMFPNNLINLQTKLKNVDKITNIGFSASLVASKGPVGGGSGVVHSESSQLPASSPGSRCHQIHPCSSFERRWRARTSPSLQGSLGLFSRSTIYTSIARDRVAPT